MFFEMLVASPQHVQWISTPSRFSVQTLGARPVDFSDPPGHLDRTWRDGGGTGMPWFGQDIDRNSVIFELIELHGKLDAGYRIIIYRPFDIWLVDT